MTKKSGVGYVSAALLCIVYLAGCAQPVKKVVIDTAKPHLNLHFALKPDFYPKMFGVKTCRPQMAVWIDVPSTGEEDTLYVTRRGGMNEWLFADNRPSALPVWYGVAGGGQTDVDAVSGATPRGESFSVTWQLPRRFQTGKIRVFVEANVSFDYNEFYSDDHEPGDPGYSDVNGQPSVIWRAELDLSQGEQTVTPEIVGHGHVLGADHAIHNNMDSLTSAKELFDDIEVTYFPGVNDAGMSE